MTKRRTPRTVRVASVNLTDEGLKDLERRARNALAVQYGEDAECLGDEVLALVREMRATRRANKIVRKDLAAARELLRERLDEGQRFNVPDWRSRVRAFLGTDGSGG